MLLEVFLSTFVILLIFLLFSHSRRPKNYPPGPRSWPVVGNLFQVGVESYKSVMHMRKKYGDIIAIDLGARRTVYINEYKLMKEAFGMLAFSGRCKMSHFAEPKTGIARGLVFTSGKTWAEQRKFTFSYIQSVFRNGAALEALITKENYELIEDLNKLCGKPIDTTHIFNISSFNALWLTIAGKRYSSKDSEFMKLIEYNTKVMKSPRAQGILVFYPKFSETFPKISGFSEFQEDMKYVRDFVKDRIDDHRKTYQEGIKRDFIDAYLEKIKNTTDPQSSFYGETGDRNLLFTVHEIFMGGADTTATIMSFIIFLMAHHPEIQKKLIEYLKLHSENGDSLKLKDRPRLPYVEAVVNEVLRFSSIATLGLMHETLEDVDFHGYRIPKGTVVVPNHYGIMHDPEVWGDPENFRPERFLSEDGETVIRHGALIPFGTGTRICPGEAFARDEIFLFTISIFQNFEVEFDDSVPAPPLDYKFGHILAPVDHKIIFQRFSK